MIETPQSAPSLVALVRAEGAVHVPEWMGAPRPDQLLGKPLDQLAELAGRVCYDSLGSGRPSDEYHQHIVQVGHLSVYEHCTFTLMFSGDVTRYLPCFLNRPGVFVRVPQARQMRVTMNLRALAEWDLHTPEYTAPCPRDFREDCQKLGVALVAQALQRSSLAVPSACAGRLPSEVLMPQLSGTLMWVEPRTRDELHVSLYFEGSRGFSHELVRHRRTAISQRSTRYVDEGNSPWVVHPLLRAHYPHEPEVTRQVKHVACSAYQGVVTLLQEALIARGVDKQSARKQARGAGRGYLGNALLTSLIVTASIAQWRYMLKLRATAAADAEIREVFVLVYRVFLLTPFASHFEDFRLVELPDGTSALSLDPATIRA